ncbi:hypothetical protein F5J12DRAFT_890422 [Pisolithus orientalis]|uniref:uncharacterized protein n=1 Tax=Pisolithus orientalis TaxID=936130 RepID=UPI002224F506|nr:uncharacterized protein F5J12DRAFT_890422 [Pisolithus orientalis]KAI6015063.1 hypothetical protein F5J12DRAFT_890422 [Pisolithus orientalis]
MKEQVLETDSVNLEVVTCVPGVNFTHVYSNNCVEIFNMLRIEAAHTVSKEVLMEITHHGINHADTGALMHCPFEEMVEILMEAAAVGGKDDCHSIAENVIFSQLAPMGTGVF